MTDRERGEQMMPVSEPVLPPLLGPWGVAVLMLVTCLVVWTTVERYMDPVGEKYVYVLAPGGGDLFLPFGGARALLLGVNPYHNDIPGLEDPWKQDYLVVNGEQIRGNYPPTHFILYLPLALVTDDFHEAGRLLFVINIATLFLLACGTWWLIRQTGNLQGPERRFSTLLIPLLFVVLSCNVATSLALERGDGGDILAAGLCWSAVILFLHRRHFPAMLLMMPAAFTKGYAVWCGLGLGLLGLRRGSRASTVTGGLVGIAVFLLPVLHYLPDALQVRKALMAVTDEVDWMSLWWNHGFRNVFQQLAPALSGAGWLTMTGYSAGIAVACWLKVLQALRDGRAQDLTLWLVLFVTCSIELMLGANPQSMVYSQVLVLPGMLIVMILAPAFVRACRLPDRTVHVLGVLNLIAAFCVFKFKLFSLDYFPLPGIGMMFFLLTVGGAMLAGWYHSRRPASWSP